MVGLGLIVGIVGLVGIVTGPLVVVVLTVGRVTVHVEVWAVDPGDVVVNDGNVMVPLGVVVGLVMNWGSWKFNGDAEMTTKVAKITNKSFIASR